jgi:hypothetical protein
MLQDGSGHIPFIITCTRTSKAVQSLFDQHAGSPRLLDPTRLGLKLGHRTPKHPSWLDIMVCNVRRVDNRSRPGPPICVCPCPWAQFTARIAVKRIATLKRTG